MNPPATALPRVPESRVRQFGSRPEKRFSILSFEDVQTQPEPKWLVHGVVPSNGLVTLYGPPNVGKTFVALDLAFTVASGQPWAGRETVAGDVLYVVAEGVAGFQKRLTAGALARGLGNMATDRVHFVAESVQLQSPEEIDALLAALDRQIGRPVALIIFDTLSRCFVGGEENSARDIGKLIDGADRVRKQTGATVLLVHHTTKDGNTERGSSALRGSADAMLSVCATKGIVELTCAKLKDAAPFKSIQFRLKPTGDSCAVEMADRASNVGSEIISSGALAALLVLAQTSGLRCKDWLGASGIPAGTFYRYLDELKRADFVSMDGKLYVVTGKGRAALALTLK